MFQLLVAGLRTGDVRFTHDEETALNKLYGFKKEKPNKKPPKPVLKAVDIKGMDQYAIRRAEEQAEKDHVEAVKRWEKWEDPIAFMQAGADRNMVRHAESDGIRLIAWLAKYVPEGRTRSRLSFSSRSTLAGTWTRATSRGRTPKSPTMRRLRRKNDRAAQARAVLFLHRLLRGSARHPRRLPRLR
jgi:hypothetical protein